MPLSQSIIEIWEEGYSATGESGVAHLRGSYEAVNFDEAVKMYLKDNPGLISYYAYSNGVHSIWACRLFNNETDARKRFG